MKLLAFTDVHADSTSLKKLDMLVRKEKPDLLINLGDFTIFEQNIEQVCAKLAKLHPTQIVVHGNHEDDMIAQAMCKRHGWTFLHQKTALVDDVLFIGYGGGGFMTTDAAFVRWTKTIVDKVKKAKKTILITHQPAYGTAVDNKWGQHVGNSSFTDFIKKHKITLALSDTFTKRPLRRANSAEQFFAILDQMERCLSYEPQQQSKGNHAPKRLVGTL